ncbi:MAG: S8 family serine peptidase [Pseudomonadota bacterium]
MSKPVNTTHTRRKVSDTLRLAITLPGAQHGQGPVKFSGAVTPASLEEMRPEPSAMQQTMDELQKMGFEVTGSGQFSITARCSKAHYETVFGTRLARHKLPFDKVEKRQANAFYFPTADSPWSPDDALMSMIDDAYIQWPHIYMNSLFAGASSALPPTVGYHHLRVPGDVTLLLGADHAHRLDITGKGVRVAMIDSGFAMDHAYFAERGYNTNVVLAPGATDVGLDNNGHGTAESANLLAMAPGIEFTGVKLDNEQFPANGATILEGLQTAMQHNPQIISVSLGYDLCPTDTNGRRTSDMHLTSLPNSLRALEAEIRAIANAGTLIVFSAGNGQVAFPGMMPEVISAGGVFVDQKGNMRASDYASGFVSKIYPGRSVPDASGLVGLAENGASYIMLPVQPGCETDRQTNDRTANDDGWAVISGTSAAAPQIAGAIALLLEKNPGLSASDVRQIFDRSSKDVVQGRASAASNENNGGMLAAPGKDTATGSGLINVKEALPLV